MKKTSIIFSVFMVIGIIVLLGFTQTQIKSENDSTQNNLIKFHVQNCDNCSSVLYCIDGNDVHYPGACQFGWDDCSIGNHTIFVQCGNKTGIANYYCYGGDVQDVYVTVNTNGPQNPCTNK